MSSKAASVFLPSEPEGSIFGYAKRVIDNWIEGFREIGPEILRLGGRAKGKRERGAPFYSPIL